MSRFDECLVFVLRMEGGFVDDPVDRGGRTNYGITQRSYSGWLRGMGRDDVDVLSITQADVESVYHAQYWTPLQCDTFQPPLDLVLFDTAVNHGVGRAVKILQTGIQINADGILGPVTLAAVQLDSAERISMDVLTARAKFYENIIANAPSQARFANGWANRLQALKDEAGL